MPFARSPLVALVSCIALSIALAGCASYQWGARSLNNPRVRTVYVPIFESDSFRRYLGERLTEQVVKEIERRSIMQLAPSTDADSILSGRIVADTKRVLSENRNDEPRSLEVNYQVQITWIDRQGTNLREPMNLPVAPLLLRINQPTTFVPEGGQSHATAEQQSLERLASQIVDQLEVPW